MTFAHGVGELLANPVISLSFVSWLITQTLKYLLGLRNTPRTKFTDSGGMPSSHAAVVGTASTVIGLLHGWGSDLFGLSVVVAAIVMYDAYRVRWAVGEQARRLNDLLSHSKMPDKSTVVVWRGHRIREVIVGFLLGVGLGYALLEWVYLTI